jgi:short-subunit dehydrogenase
LVLDSATRAIITGASKGIGRAIAQAFATRGVKLGLLARDESKLRELAAELGGDPIVLPADVAKHADVEAAVKRFCEEAGGLDVLVANAGVAHYENFVEQPIADAEQMVEVNVLGTIYSVKAALPPMLEAGRGHIVITSSGTGLRAFPQAAVYGATKAADKGFAEALRHELHGTGVSVTTVFPGEIESDLHAHELARLPDWRSNDEQQPAGPLAEAIVKAVEEDQRAVYFPRVVRTLGLNGIAPKLTDRLLARIRGNSAAPRRD